MGKRECRACASKRPQWKRGETGIEVAWDFEARDCGASEWVSLTRRMSTRAEEERTMEDDAWQEAMARHEFEGSRQGARTRTTGGCENTRRGVVLTGIVSVSPIPPFASGFTVNDYGHLTSSYAPHAFLFLDYSVLITFPPIFTCILCSPVPLRLPFVYFLIHRFGRSLLVSSLHGYKLGCELFSQW